MCCNDMSHIKIAEIISNDVNDIGCRIEFEEIFRWNTKKVGIILVLFRLCILRFTMLLQWNVNDSLDLFLNFRWKLL